MKWTRWAYILSTMLAFPPLALADKAARKQALVAVRNGNYDQAIKLLDSVLKTNPDDTLALFGRGTAQTGKKDYDRAIVDFSRAIELQPSRGSFYEARGFAYQQKGV